MSRKLFDRAWAFLADRIMVPVDTLSPKTEDPPELSL